MARKILVSVLADGRAKGFLSLKANYTKHF